LRASKQDLRADFHEISPLSDAQAYISIEHNSNIIGVSEVVIYVRYSNENCVGPREYVLRENCTTPANCSSIPDLTDTCHNGTPTGCTILGGYKSYRESSCEVSKS